MTHETPYRERHRKTLPALRAAFVSLLLLLPSLVSAQRAGLSTNFLYWATTTPNAGMEFRLSSHLTLGVSMGSNPFDFPNRMDANGVPQNPKLRHLLVMPEMKYWFCRSWERHYIGITPIYLHFNVGGLPFPKFLDGARYEGRGYGGGVTYGYQWAIGRRWGLELSAGAGYLYMDYGKYRCGACGRKEKQVKRHYVGPTKLALSLIYYME